MTGASLSGMKPDTRPETDSLGSVDVPSDRYWGAQTERSRENFAIGEERMPLDIVRALALIKAAAAETNRELGLLDADVAELIIAAAEEILAGTWDAEFPLSVWQTGSGTQTNMNVNEVVANCANQRAGTGLGSKRPVHPNDHVNRCQSSNDVFPSAIHIASVDWTHRLLNAVRGLRHTCEERATAFADVVKIGRTHLQDATPLTLGQEISGWAAQLEAAEQAITRALQPLFELPLGGTAVGTGLGAHPAFGERTIAAVAVRTGHPFVGASNRFASLAANDACVGLSGALRQLACACMKVANDVRWLASGPRAGLGELRIPKNEPGSSIMPGKVNPTQCEALTMVCVQVMGNDGAIGFAGSQGNFELNVFKPVIAYNLLQSLRLQRDAIESFDLRCLRGLEPERDVLARNVERSLMLVTALAPTIGYDAAAKVAQHAHERGVTLREAALELEVVSAEDFDRIVDPNAMTHPGR